MMFIKDLFQKPNKTDISPYEKELLKEYGSVKKRKSSGINWLFIADTHGRLSRKMIDDITIRSGDCSSVILMGDHSRRDVEDILWVIPEDRPVYGLLGNHDGYDLYEDTKVLPLGNGVHMIDGISVAAFNGGVKYKNSQTCMYSQEEMLALSEKLPGANICLSHSNPYIKEDKDYAHVGFMGITEYVYRRKIPLLIHGHLHEAMDYRLLNGCRVIGMYGVRSVTV